MANSLNPDAKHGRATEKGNRHAACFALILESASDIHKRRPIIATHHTLSASPETVHWGIFDAALPAVMTVASGDRVTIEAVSGGADIMPPPGFRGGDFVVLPEHLAIQRQVTARPGHIMTGPVAVEGAVPGDMLEVRILDVQFRQDWGWTAIRPLRGTLPEDFPISRLSHIPIDRQRRVAHLPWGGELPLAPFFGVMGVAPPPVYGACTSIVPREFGGNIDNKELGAGATLFLPVWTAGANFSAGDGHAVQGDGEVCLTALETALAGTFELILHKASARAKPLTFPRAETPTHYITMGLDEDLDDAAKQALREMIVLLGEVAGLAPADAYMMCSLACDLRVTQLVDVNKGVHAMIPKALFA
jgi:acetamidase/formamidase